MFCIKCGQELPAKAIFCPYCGAKSETEGSMASPSTSTHASVRSKKGLIVPVAIILCILAPLFVVLASLGSNSDPQFTDDTITDINSFNFDISQNTVTFERVGDTVELTTNASDTLWFTDAPEIVSVSNTGLVTALNGGTANVYAQYNDITRTCLVNVNTYSAFEEENREAMRLLNIAEDYKSKYRTYSLSDLQSFYDEYVDSGYIIELYDYPGPVIHQSDNAEIHCYKSDWYYSLIVYYFDESNSLIYEDNYDIVTDGSFHTDCPTYSRWVSGSIEHELFTVKTDTNMYHCLHDAESDSYPWLFYETEYIDDTATRTIVIK